jgi:hypothetical protein
LDNKAYEAGSGTESGTAHSMDSELPKCSKPITTAKGKGKGKQAATSKPKRDTANRHEFYSPKNF